MTTKTGILNGWTERLACPPPGLSTCSITLQRCSNHNKGRLKQSPGLPPVGFQNKRPLTARARPPEHQHLSKDSRRSVVVLSVINRPKLCVPHREKMICRILLLIILTSHVCAATFVVNVTQSSYQTEENHNITLEWTFTPKPGTSSRPPDIYCELRTYLRPLVLFHVVNRVEMTFYHDGQFRGRVQSDRDALREGRLRLHMSRLRTEDSGQYWCKVETEQGGGYASCEVLVSAADLQSQTPTIVPEQEDQEKTRSYAEGGAGRLITLGVGGAFAAAALLIIYVTVLVKIMRK
ncbi:uncharacterized protein LOC133420262 isoform X2 [Cololabis saira]|uniref:uncharacterized protein LOC133420262 isoform X2 n=1 Tax=Cololabis saira TaxID=129043 RepID=UPI002AD33A2F|nr:uncharacterized protein LOC133420262 isoform X2 [Cololabis saira]